MVKIAITISKLNSLEKRIYNNGINQNIIFLYELLNNLGGLTVYLASDLIDNVQKYKHFKLTNHNKLFLCPPTAVLAPFFQNFVKFTSHRSDIHYCQYQVVTHPPPWAARS